MKSICVVACVHGNEPYGAELLERLKKMKLGRLKLILANKAAYRKNVRFIDEDLNRCFPGNPDGNAEQKIAFRLTKLIRKFDIVIDLHSASTPTPAFIITTRFTKRHRELICRLPILRVVLMSRKLAQGKSLIDHCPLGISLEMGQHDDPRLADKTIRVLRTLFIAHGLIKGRKGKAIRQRYYEVYGLALHKDNPAHVKGNFIQEKGFVPILITPPNAGEVAYLKARKVKGFFPK